MEREWIIENHSKKRIALLMIRIPLFNERYVKLLNIGGTLGSLEKRGLGNVFIRFKLKNMAPNDERRVKVSLRIERMRTNVDEFGSLTDIPSYVRNDYVRKASSSPRRIRKIAQSIAYKVQTVQDAVEEIFSFLERNFELVDEPLDLKEMLLSGRGNVETFTILFVLLSNLVGVPARRIYGLTGEGKSYVWAEILTKNGWIEVDPARFSIGVPTDYIPIKIEDPDSKIPEWKIVTIKSPERGLIYGVSVREISSSVRRIS